MLVEVKNVDEGVVRRLTDIYAESMDALEKHNARNKGKEVL